MASQVRDELGLTFLGVLEVLRPSANTKVGSEPRDPKQVMPKTSILRYSIDHPISRFAETLRSIKVAADLALADDRPKVIGVISVLPNEGKTTVSKNFASLLAHLGSRTLLMDGDLRNPGLTRALAPHADAGILEAIDGHRALGDLLMSEPESGLSFLPAVVGKNTQHNSERLASRGMEGLLTEGAKEFDYIIVDLPPLGPVVDVRAAAATFDAFVLVVEWGRTPRLVVDTALAADKLVRDKCIGVVFNKVKLRKLKLYESHGSKDYYHGRYGKYYTRDSGSA